MIRTLARKISPVRLYYKLKYSSKLDGIDISILDGAKVVRVIYLVNTVALTIEELTIPYLLTEKYYSSIDELVTKNNSTNTMHRLYLPSQEKIITELLFEYKKGSINTSTLLIGLIDLNNKALTILNKVR